VDQLPLRATLKSPKTLPDETIIEYDVGPAHGTISSRRLSFLETTVMRDGVRSKPSMVYPFGHRARRQGRGACLVEEADRIVVVTDYVYWRMQREGSAWRGAVEVSLEQAMSKQGGRRR
jgi:hypothetical protein